MKVKSLRLKVKTPEGPRQEKSKAPSDGTRPWLEEFDQFIHGHFNVAQYGAQQAGTKRFAGMHGDSGGSAVRVFEKDMAAARPIDNKAAFLEGTDYLSSLGAGKTGHTVIC